MLCVTNHRGASYDFLGEEIYTGVHVYDCACVHFGREGLKRKGQNF